MSLATLLDRNKTFAATDAVANNPKIPWLPHQLSYIINVPQLSPSILVSGYVYHTADGTLETIVGPTAVTKH